ncbi:hypothetical protein NG791_27125 [Laspinema sp. D1]|uniref:hypothetical protein n=1 Tax=Laspinema palackyanum TaxID=3231601 RepID=UPI00347B621E|nr:hypothetical protein [Laspinema sp. D2b]
MTEKKELHPNSLKNLTYHEGRPKKWGEQKKTRKLTVTETGWEGVVEIAQEQGHSVSELLEMLGRGQLSLQVKDIQQ